MRTYKNFNGAELARTEKDDLLGFFLILMTFLLQMSLKYAIIVEYAQSGAILLKESAGMSNLKRAIGNRITELCKERNISITTLSIDTGITSSMIRDILNPAKKTVGL